jgi:hypothetical protein
MDRGGPKWRDPITNEVTNLYDHAHQHFRVCSRSTGGKGSGMRLVIVRWETTEVQMWLTSLTKITEGANEGNA